MCLFPFLSSNFLSHLVFDSVLRRLAFYGVPQVTALLLEVDTGTLTAVGNGTAYMCSLSSSVRPPIAFFLLEKRKEEEKRERDQTNEKDREANTDFG